MRTRRRTTLVVGLALLALASATACIFDKGGDYQGGGRLDKGATAQVPTESAPAPQPTATDTNNPPDDDGGGNPPVDAATGG